MRFRAEISNILTFTRLIQTVQNLSKRAILKLAPDKICIISGHDSEGKYSTQCWSQIEKDTIFSNYRVESNSENEIYIELPTDVMAKAMTKAPGATQVIFRLSKNGRAPILQFDMKTANRSGGGSEYNIVQEVNVRVLKREDFLSIKEPLIPDPEVHIILPPLQTMKVVAERMRALSEKTQRITLSANSKGKLSLGVMADFVQVDTNWSELKHPHIDDSSQEEESQEKDPNQFRQVTLDSSSFIKFLTCSKVAEATICCICENLCAVFYVYVSGGVLTFFLPAITEDGDY